VLLNSVGYTQKPGVSDTQVALHQRLAGEFHGISRQSNHVGCSRGSGNLRLVLAVRSGAERFEKREAGERARVKEETDL
jgi:hypothetical protein